MKESIEQAMLALRDDAQAKNLSRFFKTGKGEYGEGDRFLGIKVPQTRVVVAAHWRECTLDDLDGLVASPWHEMRLCALLVLVQIFRHARKTPELRGQCVDFYLSHTRFINNWDLVDLSCYEILGVWLLDRDRSILYDLARCGKTIWEQRIGIVSCMQFARHGEFDDLLAVADILLHHEHDLIHTAVGWMLREVGKRDQARLEGFLLPRYAEMPRTMLRYAIEKFPEELRMRYLKGTR